MAGDDEGGEPTAGGDPAVAGWSDKVVHKYREIREQAETYPYVWASYILVYGGFGCYLVW